MRTLTLLLLFSLTSLVLSAQSEVEPNNSFSQATVLTLIDGMMEVNGALSSDGDQDYYRVEVPRAGVLVANVRSIEAPIDIQIDLFRADETNIASERDLSSRPVDLVQSVCDAAVYFFRVSDVNNNDSSADPYQFTVSFDTSDVYECNETFDDATLIGFDEPISAQIYSTGDQDYYEVRVSRPGVLVANVTSITDPVDIRIDLYNANERQLASERDLSSNPVDLIQSVCDTGVYYFLVGDVNNNNSSASSYRFTVSFDTSDIYECNETFNDATPVGFDEIISAQIYSMGDQDYYEVRVPRPGVLVANVTSITDPVDIQIDLFNADERQLASERDLNSSPVDLIKSVCDTGVYYFLVTDVNNNNFSASPYRFTVSFDTSDVNECNETFDDATLIGFDEQISAQIYSTGDQDFYEVRVPRPGVLVANVTSITDPVDIQIDLFNANEMQLASERDLNSNPVELIQSVCDTGTFYFLITDVNSNNSSSDPYRFTVAFDTSDVYECNNTFETATQIPFCEDIRAAIGSPQDVDFYQFPGIADEMISITIIGVAEQIDLTAAIRDSNETVVLTNSGSLGQALSFEFTPTVDGDYYLTLSDRSNNASSLQLYDLRLGTTGCVINGTDDSALDAFIDIYPNPAVRQVTVDLAPSVWSTSATATIYDMAGRSVRQMIITGPRQQLDLSDLPIGVFAVKISTDKGTIVRQIVKR